MPPGRIRAPFSQPQLVFRSQSVGREELFERTQGRARRVRLGHVREGSGGWRVNCISPSSPRELFHALRYGINRAHTWYMTQPATQAVSVIGFPDATAAFEQRHPQFMGKMQTIEKAINVAVVRVHDNTTLPDRLVYCMGTLIAESFMEILLVAANGYGGAAMKLLRTMYEQTVTLKYLHEHPEEAARFLEYHAVQRYRLVRPIEETFGEGTIPKDEVENVTEEYKTAKKQFMTKSCKSVTCSEERVSHTWSKLDFVSMAKKAGDIGNLIVNGYYIPLGYAHPTLSPFRERFEFVAEGHLMFTCEEQPKIADMALMTAHNCLLTALEVQANHFNIQELKELIDGCVRDWRDVWSPTAVFPDEKPGTPNAEQVET
jgi:Family of unknown function (DUF5677)